MLIQHLSEVLDFTKAITVALIGGMFLLLVARYKDRNLTRRLNAEREEKEREARKNQQREFDLMKTKLEMVVQATTVNHHASDPPTLVDRLDTVAGEQTEVKLMLAQLSGTVEAHHEEQQRRNDQQDARLHSGSQHMQRIDDMIVHYHGGTA